MANINQISPDGGTTVYDIEDTPVRSSIARTEDGTSPSATINAGEEFYHLNVLYTATADIATTDTITPNSNCEVSPSVTSQIAQKADKSALGTASTKNSTSVVTESSDLVESGAVYNAIQEFTKKVSNNEVYGLRQGKGNMVDLDLVGGSLAWNQLVRNGNFADTSNWSASASATFSVSNHVATYKAAARYGNLSTVIAQAEKAGHKLLYSYKCKSYTNSNTVFSLRKFTSISPVAYTDTIITLNTSNKDYSGIVSIASDIVSLMVFFQDNNASGWGNIEISNVMVIDLTQLFGSEIADYIYSLEQATAGAGVEWFKQYFPNDYYAYNAGAIQSVNVESRKVVGKNLIKQFIRGYFNNSSNKLILDETSETVLFYAIKGLTYTSSASIELTRSRVGRISDVNIVNNKPVEDVLNLNDNARTWEATWTGWTVWFVYNSKSDEVEASCQVEIGTKATAYEPYTESIYPFDSTKQLRGIPKLVDNKLNYDGDIYTADGQITRKYGIVNLGTATWLYQADVVEGSITGRFFTNATYNIAKPSSLPLVSRKYKGHIGAEGMVDNCCRIDGSGNIVITDTAYTDAETFKTAMNGIYLVYELATPTTETAQPYQNPQRAYSDGTEEMVDAGVSAGTRDVAVPVGNDSTYYLSDTLPSIEDYVDGTAKILEVEIDTKADASVISEYVEDGATCKNPNGYAIGEHFQKNGKFCTAIASIASGATFTLNTNYVEGTIADNLPKQATFSGKTSTGGNVLLTANKNITILAIVLNTDDQIASPFITGGGIGARVIDTQGAVVASTAVSGTYFYI